MMKYSPSTLTRVLAGLRSQWTRPLVFAPLRPWR
eukprot:XP_001709907.1 Hypothetical protein GL50803_33469 [Giardia lamblia ATCC 50803]